MKRPLRSRASTFLLLCGLVTGAGVLATQMATGCFNAESDCGRDGVRDGCQGTFLLTTSSSTSGNTGGTSSSSASSSSTSTSTSTTSSSGTGGKPECTSASGCSVPAVPCYPYGTADCDAGKCEVTYTAHQAYGNCNESICDTNGNLSSAWDAGNVFMGANPCITFPCTNGKPMMAIAPPGTPCTQPDGGTGVCEPDPSPFQAGPGAWSCGDCNATQPCGAGYVCSMYRCVPAHCANGGKDPDETAIDCGGPNCLPCGTGQTCGSYQDCFSQVCSTTTLKCLIPSCSDLTQNGSETDKDCGGPLCDPCVGGLKCAQPSDCQSKVCLPPASPGAPNRCANATCNDGVQNGSETAVDCGGDGGCPPCAPPDGG